MPLGIGAVFGSPFGRLEKGVQDVHAGSDRSLRLGIRRRFTRTKAPYPDTSHSHELIQMV
jgi:hypothetical protein